MTQTMTTKSSFGLRFSLTFNEVTYIKRLLKPNYLNRYKSYVDKRRRFLEFQADDKVFRKASPTKGIRRINCELN